MRVLCNVHSFVLLTDCSGLACLSVTKGSVGQRAKHEDTSYSNTAILMLLDNNIYTVVNI